MRDDFNEVEGTLFIRKNKSHKERRIPLSDDVAAMCRNYLHDSRKVIPNTEYMFPSPDGAAMNANGFLKHFVACGMHQTLTAQQKRSVFIFSDTDLLLLYLRNGLMKTQISTRKYHT